ncbi:MAG: vWA domain-containing protein [Candidatus Polarisedimenticolia bacterium]
MSNDDHDIRDFFMRARRADQAEAPELNELIREATPAPIRRRPLFAAAALGTLAAGALVLAALPLLRAPDSTIEPEQPRAERPMAPAPPSTPMKTGGKVDAGSTVEPKDSKKPVQPVNATEAESSQVRRKPALRKEVSANTDEPPPQEAEPAPQGKTIAYQSEFIEGMPVIGHNYQDQLTLAPGVTDTDGDGKPDIHGTRESEMALRFDAGKVATPASRRQASEAHLEAQLERAYDPAFNTESYAPLPENPFLRAADSPVSTFSVDVDTASYAVVRRFLDEGRLPPPDAVRIEEMINYFPYHDDRPRGNDPFSVSAEIAVCPWEPRHQLARIALKGKEVAREELAGSNLVFLVDVSGSMDQPAKLPLVVSSLRQLVSQLDGRDEVAIVVYAGSSGMVLSPTRGSAKGEILAALERLRAGGSTNGGEGLRLAYATARRQFIEGGVNRVILATDGDFNVGITDRGELVRFVEDQARAGVFLTVLGFGMGNYKDDMLEMLADKGNGNYAYIDTPREARKALVEQIGGTLVTIAKDVKIQVEFNPEHVGAYRLIGYENRMLRREDFNDDRKDAGEIGSGHTVTALYELIPPGSDEALPGVDPLRYQTPQQSTRAAGSDEVFTVKLRYKEPDGQRSRLIERHVNDEARSIGSASEDLRFAAAVAAFGMILRDSSHRGSASLEMAAGLAQSAMDSDDEGYRREFVRLVQKARSLQKR